MPLQINFVGGALNGQAGTIRGDSVVTIGAVPPPPSIPVANGQALIPLMTGPTTSGIAISATSEYSESGITASAWRACDGVLGPGWYHGWSSSAKATSVAPQDWIIQFGNAVPVYGGEITIRSDANTLAPISGTFDAFDGANWIILHAFSNLAWSNGETKTFTVAPTNLYSRYRFRWIDSGPLCQIVDLQLRS